MKQRILENLYAFSNHESDISKIPLFDALLKELELKPKQLQERSRKILKELLHNYAFFEISTIDKFTHKIIRTFARDLKISQAFEVILDTDTLLNEAVGRLLNRAGEENELTKILLDFSLEKINEDKSWDIAYDLYDTGKLLFQENHNTNIKALSKKDIEDFVQLQKKLKTAIKNSEDIIKSAAKSSLELINSEGLEFTDFTRSSFPKFMQGISEGGFNIDFTANWKNNFDSIKLYNKSCPEPVKIKLDSLHQQFSVFFKTIKDSFYRLSFLKNVYRNTVPLTVLKEIDKEIREIQKEKDILPIHEFNTIIAKEIKNQPVPFIYERLGEKYRHYFIDEFQDTSQMQWENLIPLVGNAIEGENEKGEKGSLLLVGDAKQAIYRWRGGRAEQFLNLLNLKANPFVVEPHIKNLDTNWRSKKEIVHFNNAFFKFAAKKLRNPIYRSLFEENSAQKSNNENGGYVELIFTEEERQAENDEYCTKTIAIIISTLAAGYSLRDICILVRSNKKGAVLADYLTEQGIPIISPDSLLLANNNEVAFLVALLQYINNNEDKEAIYYMLRYLSKEKETHHNFIRQHLENIDVFLLDNYGLKTAHLRRLATYDILEQAISCFKLTAFSDAHLSHFMDEVFDFSQKENSSIYSFLKFWSKNKEKLSVKAPESLNAVQIMTIHKSKGLEFPIVIFPYADAKIAEHRKRKLWLQVEKESFEGFSELLIDSNKELLNYNSATENIYNEEIDKIELDAYNVLYVALTRAEKALYIITTKQNSKDDYSELFIEYLKDLNLWKESQSVYSFGEFSSNSQKTELLQNQEEIPYICSNKNSSSFKIVTKAPILWNIERQEAIEKGNLIHEALSKINFQNDVEEAITELKKNGDINVEDISWIKEKIKQVIFHPQLNAYYQKDLIIYNEKELLAPNGIILRPDRLVVSGKNITLLDYKTGSKSETHKNQLIQYSNILEEMNYVVDNMVLVYINEIINPIFI